MPDSRDGQAMRDRKTISDGKTRRSDCPIDYALECFGDRWSLLLVRDLLFKGAKSFRELLAADEGIATNILAARLKKLEADGVIARTPDPEDKRRVLYSLTAKGRDIAPILVELIAWSTKYDAAARAAAPQDFLDRLKRDRDGLLAALIGGT